MPDSVTETWAEVVGYEGKYEVSDQGRLRSWAQPNGNCPMPSSPRLLKSTPNYAGYHVVTISSWAGRRKQHRLHCLVLEAFVGPRPPGHHGAHKYDDKNDNRLENLAWKTVGDNTRDRSANGRTACGVRHGRYKEGKFVGQHARYYTNKHVK